MIGAYAFIALAAVLVIGNSVFMLTSKKRIHLAFNAAALLLLAASAWFMGGPATYFNFFSANAFSSFFIALFSIGMLLLNLLAYGNSKEYKNFAVLASFALVGMFFVVSAASLLGIFIGLELMAVPSAFIVLASRRESIEAATKLFIMTSIAVSLLSFAIVLMYGASNSILLVQGQQNNLTLFALVLFIASLGFEASIFPFSVLIPDVYQGSGAFATALLGGLNKKAGLAALMQVLILVFIGSDFAFALVAILAAVTMFYGNLVALSQDNLKRMLAYSSIAQAGYILIGLALQNAGGISASLFQIFAHAFIFIGVMSVVAWLEANGKSDVSDLIGLYKENRFCAIALTIFLIALLGVPLTTGFVGKFLLFLGAVESNMAWLAVVGIINSVISAFYYLKVMSAVYTNKVGAKKIRIDRATLFVVGFCLAVTILFGIYPQPVIQAANGAAAYLFAGRVI